MKHTASLALAAALFIPVPAALAAGEGEWWSMTTQVDMPGMPAGMVGGAQAVKFCRVKGDENKPVTSGNDKNCAITDVKHAGNTMTFRMKCTGKDAMTGSGEMTHTPASFSQKVRMRADGQDMTLVSVGKRVGGACKS